MMKKWGSWILVAVLSLGLIGVGSWGTREYQARQKLQNRAEGQYQKAYHELAWHMDTLSGQLAQILISSSQKQATLGLATVWRQVFAAQANIGGLPLGNVPLDNSEKFLADTGDVSHALLSRIAASGGKLSDSEQKIVRELYDRSKALKSDLEKMSAEILNRDVSWTQAEVATMEAGSRPKDNTITDGFRLMERKMEEYPEINFGEDFTRTRPEVKKINGNQNATLSQAEDIARKWWFSAGDQHPVSSSYEGVGDIPTYGIEFSPQAGEEQPVYVDVSKIDGTVIWAMKPKPAAGATVDLSQGERNALSFLEKHGFPPMTAVQSDQDDSTGTYTFVPLQGQTLLYPDQVKIQVALDNGEIIGYEGTPYYMYHKNRNLPAPRITEAQLRKKINPGLKVEMIRPALIADIRDREILTWEVRGSIFEEKFVIFYNAENGNEEQITRVTPPPKYRYDASQSPSPV